VFVVEEVTIKQLREKIKEHEEKAEATAQVTCLLLLFEPKHKSTCRVHVVN
jgi:hypothetical protein